LGGVNMCEVQINIKNRKNPKKCHFVRGGGVFPLGGLYTPRGGA